MVVHEFRVRCQRGGSFAEVVYPQQSDAGRFFFLLLLLLMRSCVHVPESGDAGSVCSLIGGSSQCDTISMRSHPDVSQLKDEKGNLTSALSLL